MKCGEQAEEVQKTYICLQNTQKYSFFFYDDLWEIRQIDTW